MSLCCLSVLCVFGRQNGAAGGDNKIDLDVTVTDKSGHLTSGLQTQDFQLLDNKTPQQILSFRAIQRTSAMPDSPVQVVLVLDEVNTGFDRVAIARQQMQNFLGRDEGKLAVPTSIVFFSDKGAQVGTSPTRDGNVLISGLKQHEQALRTINRAQGFYGAGDRFQLSLRTLDQLAAYEATKPGRKLVIWISPGWPLLSGPNVQLTSKQQQDLFRSVVSTSAALRQARITLYSVDPLGTSDAGGFRTFYWEQFSKGVKSPNQMQIGNLGLQVFAFQSGGRVLNSSNDIAGEIGECVNDASSYYVLTFEGRPADGPNDYHALTVKVDKPGLTAHTRAGYYAQPGPRTR
jgi:VWFA-related protein